MLLRKKSFCAFEGTGFDGLCSNRWNRKLHRGLANVFAFYNISSMNKYKSDSFQCVIHYDFLFLLYFVIVKIKIINFLD